jgi:hypothetical protein
MLRPIEAMSLAARSRSLSGSGRFESCPVRSTKSAVYSVDGLSGDGAATIAPYPAIRILHTSEPFCGMCSYCRLATPSGPHKVCHACAIAIREEIRRGLHAIEEYLGDWSELERWLADEE